MDTSRVSEFTPKELADWVSQHFKLSCYSFEAAFGADDVDGKAFCCLKDADLDDLFPLLGQKFRFKNWFKTLTLPQLSLWPEVDSGKEVDLMGVEEFASFVRLTCPSLAQTLADQQIDGFSFLGTSTTDLRGPLKTIGDRAKCTKLKEELAALQPAVKAPAKKRKKISKEKIKEYKRNRGSKYEPSWTGPETRKLYPTGWKNGRKIFYRQKCYSPKKRGSITPPHFWDLDFPEYEIPVVEKTPPRPGSYAARRLAKFRARAMKQDLEQQESTKDS